MHKSNIYHGDIKLQNLLLDETKTRVKIIDFGLSIYNKNSNEKLNIHCGTPVYFAPEIAMKEAFAG